MRANSWATEALARTVLLVQRDIYPTVPEEKIVEALTGTAITLTASKAALATVNGQTALVTTAILCAQVGVELFLDFEEAAILGAQPPLRGEGLRESLLDLTHDLIIPAQVGRDGTFGVGIATRPRSGGIAIAGGDWSFRLSVNGEVGVFDGELPIGPGLAATAAAAEVFRYAMLRLGDETGARPHQEHPLRGPLPAAHQAEPFTWTPTDIGRVDAISAGALVTSALYLLLRWPGFEMQLRVIDGDDGAPSNLNRYLLLRRILLDRPKVAALESYSTKAIAIKGIPDRFEDATEHGIVPLADRVLVGVDDIPSRWRTQRAAPGWLGVAATSHFEVVVSEHMPSSPCAGCLHPRDDPGPADEIPTISFVSAMSGFLLAYRLARASAGHVFPSQTLAYPFNLAGERPVWELPVAARPDCPVGCAASAAERERAA